MRVISSPYNSMTSAVGRWPQSWLTMMGNCSREGRYLSNWSMHLLTVIRLHANTSTAITGPPSGRIFSANDRTLFTYTVSHGYIQTCKILSKTVIITFTTQLLTCSSSSLFLCLPGNSSTMTPLSSPLSSLTFTDSSEKPNICIF